MVDREVVDDVEIPTCRRDADEVGSKLATVAWYARADRDDCKLILWLLVEAPPITEVVSKRGTFFPMQNIRVLKTNIIFLQTAL